MGDQEPQWTSTDTCPNPYGCNFDICPTGPCPSNGCTPAVDSLFQATWGCTTDITECNVDISTCTGGGEYKRCTTDGCAPLTNITSFETNQIDGWTLPYRLHIKGNTENLAACNAGTGASNVNAIGLTLSRCPTTEDLSDNGQFNTVTDTSLNPPVTYSTISVNLQVINQNQLVGCGSPCSKLNQGPRLGHLKMF